MSMEKNNEFQFIEFKREYKRESCESLRYEIFKLKNNLIILTKIDNGILQKVVETNKDSIKRNFSCKPKSV